MPEFKKYPSIHRLGHAETYGIFSCPEDVVVIQEKIDGGNGQFRWDATSAEIAFGSRNNSFYLGDGGAQDQQFGENAQWVIEKICRNGVDEGLKSLDPTYIYYGEWCKKHTINYNWEEMPKFVGFDVYNTLNEQFLSASAARDEFERLGLPFAPVIIETDVLSLDLDRLENFIGQSSYYDGVMEGIVIKNYFRKNHYGRQLFAKIVTQQFKESNMKMFGGGVKPVTDDTTRFINNFYTEARIRKAIFRLESEGGMQVDRSMMSKLPYEVFRDILQEECDTIARKFKMIRFDIIKKSGPSKCLQVLDEMIDERALDGLTDHTKVR